MTAPGAPVSRSTLKQSPLKKKKKIFSESQSLFQGEAWESGCGGDLTFRVHLLCSNILCRLSNLTLHNEPKFCVWEN